MEDEQIEQPILSLVALCGACPPIPRVDWESWDPPEAVPQQFLLLLPPPQQRGGRNLLARLNWP